VYANISGQFSGGASVVAAPGKRFCCRPHPHNQISQLLFLWLQWWHSVDCEQYAKLGCKISEFHVFAPPNAALHSAARGGCPLPITPFPFPPPLGQLAMCVWESRGSSTDGLPAFAPLLKSPPTESPLQFHRLAIHRLLNSPTSYYTADKLHRLVNLRHDEFSTDEKSATGKETSGCRRRLIYRLRRLTVGSGPWKQRWAPHVML